MSRFERPPGVKEAASKLERRAFDAPKKRTLGKKKTAPVAKKRTQSSSVVAGRRSEVLGLTDAFTASIVA